MAELFSPGKIIFILLVAFFIFGPKKLPEMGRAAGKTLVEFKKAVSNIMDNDSKPSVEPVKETVQTDSPEKLS